VPFFDTHVKTQWKRLLAEGSTFDEDRNTCVCVVCCEHFTPQRERERDILYSRRRIARPTHRSPAGTDVRLQLQICPLTRRYTHSLTPSQSPLLISIGRGLAASPTSRRPGNPARLLLQLHLPRVLPEAYGYVFNVKTVLK